MRQEEIDGVHRERLTNVFYEIRGENDASLVIVLDGDVVPRCCEGGEERRIGEAEGNEKEEEEEEERGHLSKLFVTSKRSPDRRVGPFHEECDLQARGGGRGTTGHQFIAQRLIFVKFGDENNNLSTAVFGRRRRRPWRCAEAATIGVFQSGA